MKKVITLCAVLVFVFAMTAFAQKPMDSASEKAVQITQQPTVTNNNGSTATLTWTTDRQAANHVKYRRAGSNDAWKSAYESGGGTTHNLQLTGLTPGQTYEYQILTRDGDVRTTGQFQAGGAAGATPTAATTGATPTSTTPTSGDKVAIYRAVGPNNLHTFSTSAGSPMAGFNQEGVAAYLLASQRAGTAPVYRLTNQQGDTLLTTNESERASAASQGYRDEGIVGYIASSQWGGTQPFYRMSSPTAGHFYTANASEHQSALQGGFHDEGTLGYVWTQQ